MLKSKSDAVQGYASLLQNPSHTRTCLPSTFQIKPSAKHVQRSITATHEHQKRRNRDDMGLATLQSSASAPRGTAQHCALVPDSAQRAVNSSVVVTGPAINCQLLLCVTQRPPSHPMSTKAPGKVAHVCVYLRKLHTIETCLSPAGVLLQELDGIFMSASAAVPSQKRINRSHMFALF